MLIDNILIREKPKYKIFKCVNFDSCGEYIERIGTGGKAYKCMKCKVKDEAVRSQKRKTSPPQ